MNDDLALSFLQSPAVEADQRAAKSDMCNAVDIAHCFGNREPF